VPGEYDELFERFAETPYADLLGIKLLELSRGHSRLSMVVKPDHLNFAGMLHGGVVMSLADQAFACATNTYGKLYVAVHFGINLIASVKVGETILAEGNVGHMGRTIGYCEMTVIDGSGKLLAKANGTVTGIHNRKPTGEPIKD
jgi:acyl-CoA thioesterase